MSIRHSHRFRIRCAKQRQDASAIGRDDQGPRVHTKRVEAPDAGVLLGHETRCIDRHILSTLRDHVHQADSGFAITRCGGGSTVHGRQPGRVGIQSRAERGGACGPEIVCLKAAHHSLPLAVDQALAPAGAVSACTEIQLFDQQPFCCGRQGRREHLLCVEISHVASRPVSQPRASLVARRRCAGMPRDVRRARGRRPPRHG